MARLAEYRRHWWWAVIVRPVAFLAVSVVIARFLVSLVGAVDWAQVADALGRLSWTAAPPLVALLLLRQAFNSVPLAVFVPGLGFRRAFQNDLTANLVATMAPPPADVAIRASMFRSWGIAPADGMPGVGLNTLAFYVIRFSVPVVGLVALLGQELSTAQVWLAVGSLTVAAVVVVGLVLVSRGERFARAVGRHAAQAVLRFRSGVDPDRWAETAGAFRQRMATRVVRGLPPALAALTAMVVTDGLIVLLALRLVGVGAGLLPVAVVLGTFLLSYPLTALPLAGLGVLDATLVVAYTQVAGVAAEPEVVAALVVWRLVTLLGTLLLGAATLGLWRMSAPRRAADTLPPPAPDEVG